MSRILRHIAGVAEARPDAVALRQGEQRLSYAELVGDVNLLADRLRGLGARSLGIYLDNGIEWILLDLAALAAGIRIVPLPWFFSSAQLCHAIDSGRVDLVAFDRALPDGVVGNGALLGSYRGARLQAIESGSTAENAAAYGTRLSFTSGSTGAPKGIELEAAFIEQTCASICAAVPGDAVDVHLSILPYATLLENIAGVYVPLMLGKCVAAESAATVGLLPDLRFDPARLAQAFNAVRPASLILTPQLLELVCVLVERGAVDPACLEFVAVGGARVGEFLLQRARAAGLPVYEGYGLTEFGSVAILNTPAANRPGSAGKPLPGVRVSLCDDGEIRLATDIEVDDNGVRRRRRLSVDTGDYGSIDADGFVYVHGRKSSVIVLANGRNVAPEWVETELTASPSIRQAFVYDNGGAELAALLVASDSAIDDAELEAELERINHDLPPYARIYRWHRLQVPFSRDDGTLTDNGRLRRPRIRQMLPLLLEGSALRNQTTSGDFTKQSLQETLSWQ